MVRDRIGHLEAQLPTHQELIPDCLGEEHAIEERLQGLEEP